MILHIGNGKTVRKKDIIGIFDFDNVTVTAGGRAFLSRAQKESRVSVADADIPRSFLLLDGEKKKESRVILSHISSLSLGARGEEPAWGEE
ncbi:MAG: DUF370 domain-containing protein [Clostridia bacterium]|nr:DUF370 domain-containing protein [Clostridia bacterium]